MGRAKTAVLCPLMGKETITSGREVRVNVDRTELPKDIIRMGKHMIKISSFNLK